MTRSIQVTAPTPLATSTPCPPNSHSSLPLVRAALPANSLAPGRLMLDGINRSPLIPSASAVDNPFIQVHLDDCGSNFQRSPKRAGNYIGGLSIKNMKIYLLPILPPNNHALPSLSVQVPELVLPPGFVFEVDEPMLPYTAGLNESIDPLTQVQVLLVFEYFHKSETTALPINN